MDAKSPLCLQSARHPLLQGDVVPISLILGVEHRGIVITGPNTGGQTVALKTVGLLVAMVAAGLPIPAEFGTQIPIYRNIFADIGDEQSIEQSLSTFSAHMSNIIRILGEATPDCLVLLDELGAGTDPSEGTALGRAILRYLLAVDTDIIATTHHGELKTFAHEQEEIINASAEFDPETLSPTYNLRLGLPGRSNALAIAQNLGMPIEILDHARTVLGSKTTSIENLLSELEMERAAANDERKAEKIARDESEEIRRHLRQYRQTMENEQKNLLAHTERKMEDELIALRKTIQAAEKQIVKQTNESLRAARKEQASAEHRLIQIQSELAESVRQSEKKSPVIPEEIQSGDYIYLDGFEQPGEVIVPIDESGQIEVRLGLLRTKISKKNIRALAKDYKPVATNIIQIKTEPLEQISRIEVRGQTLDEAMPAIEQFLDQAYRSGLERLEIVHGKGTGTLRRAVREMLRNHPLVTKYVAAERREGGEGVTIAHMAM